MASKYDNESTEFHFLKFFVLSCCFRIIARVKSIKSVSHLSFAVFLFWRRGNNFFDIKSLA